MARRSILVAVVALAAAFVPAAANAATIAAVQAPFANSVALSWDVTALTTETLFRAPGACTAPPIGTAVAIGGSPFIGAPPTVNSFTDVPGQGTWCYYVQDEGTLNSNTVQATVDTVAPTTSVAVTFSGAPNFVRGAVTIVATTNADASGVGPNVLHLGTATCDAASAIMTSPWTSSAVADGAYLVCNTVADGAGNVGTSPVVPIVVDNLAPTGAEATPVAGQFVGGASVALQLTAASGDATSGVRNVQWQRSPTGAAASWVNAGALVTAPALGYQLLWNTTAAGVGDGADYLHAIITDNAGNPFTTATTQVTVDNTAPDVRAVVTAPPAVAGSPTITWTPAHDAIGIARYDVLRGTTVIGTVTNVPGATSYSFNDRNAPDHATSSYIVRALDATEHSLDSAPAAVFVDSTAQSAPRAVVAASPTNSAPALTWTAPAAFAVAHYDIYRDGTLLGSTAGPQTSYSDSAAAEGVHDYAVLARDAAAQPGVLSASFKVVLDKTSPTSGGAPTALLQADGNVQLNWPAAGDALSGVAGYVVRRASGAVPPAAADGGVAVCAPTAPSCTDPSTPSGTWSYGVFARDAAGNVALIGAVSGVVILDTTAPLAPKKLTFTRTKSKKPETHLTFTFHWAKPTDADLDRVVLVLNLKHAPLSPRDGRAVYRGLGTSTKVKLRAGQTGYLALYAYDHSGNVSLKPARSVVRLAALIPLRPLNGSVVRSASPTLTWKPQAGTEYYNVQVWTKGKRLFTGWPSKASYRVPAGKLVPGTYVWYIWPAIKHGKAAPTFGQLIGRATFTYKK